MLIMDEEGDARCRSGYVATLASVAAPFHTDDISGGASHPAQRSPASSSDPAATHATRLW